MAVLKDVATLLNFTEDDFDDAQLREKLELIISNSRKRVLSYLPHDVKKVPEELEYIVTEISVVRFNRIGNEGMSSYNQQGESMAYCDDMQMYLPAIEEWNKHHEGDGKGRVRFL